MAVVTTPRPLLGVVLLLFVSAAWGSAFPLMKDLIHRLPVEDLLTERYTLAALTLLLLKPGCLRGLARRTWRDGAALGIMFGVGQSAQALALHDLPSAVSGFAVGCSVVITPILALILHRSKVPRRVWAGVVLALAGMAVFTLLRGVGDQEISLLALIATLSAAALYSGHTLRLARLSERSGGYPWYPLTVIQLLTIGLLTGVVAVRDGIEVPASGPDWMIMGHLSVVSCALGFMARSYGQKFLPAVPSQVLMSTQPLWVALIAVLWFHEHLSWSLGVGGALMAGAMLLALPIKGAFLGKDRRRDLLTITGRAALALANRKARREDRLGLEGGSAPFIAKSACTNSRACPWHTRSLKGGGEPSLERLIARATVILQAKSLPGPGCCQSITLLGRCLCELMEESGEAHTTTLRRWFRSE